MQELLTLIHEHTGSHPYFFAFIIGMIFAMPLGVVTVIALKQRNHHGFFAGFKVALTCVSADAIIAFIVFTSYNIIIDEFRNHQNQLNLIMGIIFLILGLMMIRQHEKTPPKAGLKLHFFVLSITLFNPGNTLALITYKLLVSPTEDGIPVFSNIAVIATGAILTWLSVLKFVPNLQEKQKTQKSSAKKIPIGGILVLIIGTSLCIKYFF